MQHDFPIFFFLGSLDTNQMKAISRIVSRRFEWVNVDGGPER